jgi:hypothetical protein
MKLRGLLGLPIDWPSSLFQQNDQLHHLSTNPTSQYEQSGKIIGQLIDDALLAINSFPTM